ncbi:hypothetical protein GQ44DRAFT_642883 [Phaeosphaeriaceae sp. PMI808]|nr:hypothetical protein GQ44DRAFT_642883 [Phaeosphaeriaceae sp. PMI808]
MFMMAPILSTRALDGGKANTDALGIFYVIVAVLYTILLAGELYLLNRHRSAFCVRIRSIKVVFSAVSLLHIYLVLVLLVYPWNGMFPCAAEFWIMSVFLPSGMALFQACNARVLTAYESQRRLARNFLEGARKKRVSYTPRGLWEAWISLNAALKVYVGSIVGLVLSIFLAIILFFGSRRFHGYGVFGEASDYRTCRKGLEWLPSIIVQLFWTVIVGPWILWKIRYIQDVHSWAWQTRLAIIAGLPGTPLWVAFTFSRLDEMYNISKYFPPAGWFIPCLIVCQQVIIVIPLRDAFRSQRLQRARKTDSDIQSLTSTHSSESSKSSVFILNKELKSKASMQALEFSIENGIEPLIAWAASREFTAENTIFLREVRNFRKKWSSLKTVSTAQRRQMFNEASLIFFTLVNPFTAESPINIEYKVFKTLQSTFAGVDFDPYMRSDTPEDLKPSVLRDNVVCPWEDTLSRPTSTDSMTSTSSAGSSRGHVPSEFTDDIFDAAFESIKYLVFTNTWPRYVDAELASKV